MRVVVERFDRAGLFGSARLLGCLEQRRREDASRSLW